MSIYLNFYFIALEVICIGTTQASIFQVYSNGSYSLAPGSPPGLTWLRNASTSFQLNGAQYSTNDNTLKLNRALEASGSDDLGSFNKTVFYYSAEGGKVNITTSIQNYVKTDEGPDKGQFAVFAQTFPMGAEGTSVKNKHGVVSQFPSFKIEDGKAVTGVLAFGDLFSGYIQMKIQKWDANMSALPGGLYSGPLVLFDQHDNVVIISAFNHFTANSYFHDTNEGTIGWGIMGNVDSIPPLYTMKTIVFCSGNGINQAMEDWGYFMRKMYGRTSEAMDDDVTINYIGYYTDNGAYYYHHTEPNKTYETTLLEVYNDSMSKNIPYKYIQYDDYWYPVETSHSGYGATTKWEALPSVFPHGLEYMYEKMKLPVIAHNRFWSYKTPYAKQNGGKWDFLLDSKSGMALPLKQDFWDWLFSKSKGWGLVNYEQDWMNTQMEEISALNTNISLAEHWLKQMGNAAEKNKMKMQYCMTLPRQIMAALQIPVLSQARASDDYADGRQWRIGVTSMFLNAMQIAPFKDNFWTTSVQPGNPYSNGTKTEVNPVREAVVALFSTGPVGISDRLGLTNVSIVNRLCRKDGLLLKPGKPATALNSQIWQRAYGGDVGPQGEVYMSTYNIGTDEQNLHARVIFASDLAVPYTMKTTDIDNKGHLYYYAMDALDEFPVDLAKSPLTLDGCTKDSACVFYVTNEIQYTGENDTQVSLVIMGELDKYVPLSPQRIVEVMVTTYDVMLLLKGVPGEHVTMYYSKSGRGVTSIECVIGADGGATLRFDRPACFAM